MAMNGYNPQLTVKGEKMAIVCSKRCNLHKKLYSASCRNCGSEFTALKEDLKFGSCRNEDYIESMICNQCEENTLHFKEIPLIRRDDG